MSEKPNIILFKDIAYPFEAAKEEISLLKLDIENINEQRQLKAILLYAYAILESTLVQSYARILAAFPDRLNIDTIDFNKYKSVITSSSLSHKLVESLSEDFSKKLTYGKIKDSINRYCDSLRISIPDITFKDLEQIKELRNHITHNYTIQAQIDKCSLVRYLEIINEVICNVYQLVTDKYISYTKTKLVKDSWNYLFDSPLLKYDNHWILDSAGEIICYNDEILKKGLTFSSSEKTFLILFMANYSDLCSRYFSIADIALHVSIGNKDKIAYITELFDIYPLLLQDS